MSIDYTVQLVIDWDNNGNFTGLYDDVSSALYQFSTSRGRASITEDINPGRLKFDLRNGSGLYSPFNASGALYGKLYPGRPFQVSCTVNGHTYPIITGNLGDFGQNSMIGELPVMGLEGVEGLESMSREENIRLPLQESKRVDELIAAVLDAYGWSATARDLAVAAYTVPVYWVHRLSALSALRTLTKQELGGFLFQARNGDVTFRNGRWRAGLTSSFTTSGGRLFNMGLRRSDFVDQVSYSRAGLSIATSLSTLFTLTPVGQRMAPGSTDPLNTLNGAYSVAGKNAVTPVATTDWTFNSVADGSGTDKTAQVSVSSFTSYGGGYEITFNNLDSSDVYLTSFKVRGYAVSRMNSERLISVSVASPVATGESLKDAFDYNDDADRIQSFARFNGEVANTLQPRPRMTVLPQTTAELEQYLALDLGSIIHVTNSDANEGLYVDDDFSVEGIAWNFGVGALPSVQLNLLSRDYVRGRLFRISGGGNNYSTISGPDRISW